jgi:hypothetical protein
LQRLRNPIFGHELLLVDIDCGRLEALAILRRRDDALRKRGPRIEPAMGAAVDRNAMFGDFQQAVGQFKHLTLFLADHRAWVERRRTMAAGARYVVDDPVGIGDLPQRVAAMALLAAAALARARRKLPRRRGFFLNPSLQRRFRTVGAVKSQPTASSAFSARSASITPSSERINPSISGGRTIPLRSQKNADSSQKKHADHRFSTHRDISDSPGLGVTWNERTKSKPLQ